jgi:hypothetical protein
MVAPREDRIAAGTAYDGPDDPHAVRNRVLTGALALLLALCCFPIAPLVASTGNDPSWHAALAMAFVDHLQWGRQINFTYGPLGFLVDPVLYFQSTALMASFFMLVVYSAFLLTLFQVLRHEVSIIWAWGLTYVVGLTIITTVPPETVLFGLCFLLAIWTSRSESHRNQMLGCIYLGVTGAIGGLVVVSVGLEAALLIAVVVLTGPDRLKRLVLAASAFVITFLVLWLLVGGPPTGLWDYLSNGISIVGGYSAAMSEALTNPQMLKVSLQIVLVALVIAVISATFQRRDLRLLCAVLASGVLVVFIVHEGFIRADSAHQLRFFALAVLVPIVFISADRSRSLVIGCVALVLAVTWIFGGLYLGALIPAHRIQAVVAQFHDVIDAGIASNMIDRGQTRLRYYYAVPPSMVHAIRANSTAIEPWPGDTSLAWAYDLKQWDPEPILQQYSAYTTRLDDVDSSFFASVHAPRYLLQGVPVAINSRDPAWEPPTTELSILCRYRQIAVSAHWELLKHVTNRCGSPQFLEKWVVDKGGEVFAPFEPSAPRGDIVVATFAGLGSSARFRLEALVLFPPNVILNVREGSRLVATRFLTGTQSDFHIISVPRSAGFSAPFVPETITSIQFNSLYSADGSATLSYYAIPIHSDTGDLTANRRAGAHRRA